MTIVFIILNWKQSRLKLYHYESCGIRNIFVRYRSDGDDGVEEFGCENGSNNQSSYELCLDPFNLLIEEAMQIRINPLLEIFI